MLYKYGTFSDIDGQIYKVVLEIDDDKPEITYAEKELVFGDTPFVMEVVGDDNIYKPIKCSRATVKLLNEEYDETLNSTKPFGVKVKLLSLREKDKWVDDYKLRVSDNTHFDLEWVGYTTPNAYAQGYNSVLDEFELDCQDSVSVYKYIKYSTMMSGDGYSSAEKIVKKIAGDYSGVYVSDSFRYKPNIEATIGNTTDIYSLFGSIVFNENNFVNESGDSDSVYDVLEQLCVILNLTCTPYKDKLFFINYDAIALENEDYRTIIGNEHGLVLRRKHYTLDSGDSASADTSLSLDGFVSKVSLDCDNYQFDDTLKNLSDYKFGDKIYPYYTVSEADYNFSFVNKYITYNSPLAECKKVSIEPRLTYFWANGGDTTEQSYFVYMQYYIPNNPDIKFYLYEKDNSYFDLNTGDANWNWSGAVSSLTGGRGIENFRDSCNMIGSCAVKWASQPVNNVQRDRYNPTNFGDAYAFFTSPYGGLGNFNQITNKSGNLDKNFADIVKENVAYANIPSNGFGNFEQKMITFSFHNQVFNPKSVIGLSTTFKFYDVMPLPVACNPNLKSSGAVFWNNVKDMCYDTVRCCVRVKTDADMPLYWDGWTWKSGLHTFSLPLEYQDGKRAFETDYKVVTNYDLTSGLKDGLGYVFPNPFYDDDKSRICEVEVTIYRPWGVSDRCRTHLTLMSDFKFELASPSKSNLETEVYDLDSTYKIESENDMDLSIDMSVKFATDTSKEISKSTIFTNPTVTNNFKIDELKMEDVKFLDKNHGVYGSPEMLVVKNVHNQYKENAVKFEVALHKELPPYAKIKYNRRKFKNMVFVIDTLTKDYRYKVTNYRLVEKKI